MKKIEDNTINSALDTIIIYGKGIREIMTNIVLDKTKDFPFLEGLCIFRLDIKRKDVKINSIEYK